MHNRARIRVGVFAHAFALVCFTLSNIKIDYANSDLIGLSEYCDAYVPGGYVHFLLFIIPCQYDYICKFRVRLDSNVLYSFS